MKKRKKSYGYHKIRKIILNETRYIVSINLVPKVCRLLNIKPTARYYQWKELKGGNKKAIKYTNVIKIVRILLDHLKKLFKIQQLFS